MSNRQTAEKFQEGTIELSVTPESMVKLTLAFGKNYAMSTWLTADEAAQVADSLVRMSVKAGKREARVRASKLGIWARFKAWSKL